MSKIEQIQEAIECATSGNSKLHGSVLEMQGFTSYKNKHLFNNLGSLSTKYCEVGLHKGATFISSLYKNNITGVGVDNYSQFQEGGFAKEMMIKNTFKYLNSNQYQIYEMDCFTFPVEQFKNQFDMYCYDGNHGKENQKNGLIYFYPTLKDEFIFICDDFSWQEPKEGTEIAIKELNLKILFHAFLWDGVANGDYHNGLGIYLLKK